MKTIQRFTFSAVAAAMLFSLAGYFYIMSTQDKNTAMSAGIGAVIGHEAGDK